MSVVIVCIRYYEFVNMFCMCLYCVNVLCTCCVGCVVS